MDLKNMTLLALEKKHKQLQNRIIRKHKAYKKQEEELQKKAYIYKNILKISVEELEKDYINLFVDYSNELEKINAQIEAIEAQIEATILVNLETLKR